MNFRFAVNLSEEDYYSFNEFCVLSLPHGKKQVKNYRILIAVLFIVMILIKLLSGPISAETVTSAVAMFVAMLLFQIFLKGFFARSIRMNMKGHKKSGKLPYAPYSVVEFHDDVIVDINHDTKTEQKYSAIERVCIVGDKVIYIFISSLSAHILPFSCFESEEQRSSFIEFIKLKCPLVETY